MLILEDVITDQEINKIREFYERYKDKCYSNWLEGDKSIDITARDPMEFKIIKNIAKRYFNNPLQILASYQRQTNPHNIHIGSCGLGEGKDIHTFVLSLDTIPEFKTFVWKEKAENNVELHRYVANWGENRQQLSKINNISETEDLEHTMDINQDDFMCDYLELDGIYTCQKGCGILFNAKQFQCTSNWLKYNKWEYVELLQIHVLTELGSEQY